MRKKPWLGVRHRSLLVVSNSKSAHIWLLIRWFDLFWLCFRLNLGIKARGERLLTHRRDYYWRLHLRSIFALLNIYRSLVFTHSLRTTWVVVVLHRLACQKSVDACRLLSRCWVWFHIYQSDRAWFVLILYIWFWRFWLDLKATSLIKLMILILEMKWGYFYVRWLNLLVNHLYRWYSRFLWGF